MIVLAMPGKRCLPLPMSPGATGPMKAAVHGVPMKPSRPMPKTKLALGLSDLLKPFKVRPGTIRADGIATVQGTAKGYKREDLNPGVV